MAAVLLGQMGGGKDIGQDRRRWSNVVFGSLFGLSLCLFGWLVWPFLIPVLLGGFLAVLFAPMRDFLHRHLPRFPGLCASLCTAAVFLVICLPAAVIGFLVLRELLGLATLARASLDNFEPASHLAFLPQALVARLPVALPEQMLVSGLSSGAEMVKQLLEAGTSMGLDLFLMTVAMYYFFLDGRRLVQVVAQLVPLDRRYFDSFVKEFEVVAVGIVYGNTMTALFQGAAAMVGFWVAGVPHPVVWGAATGVVALIPFGGSALVWAPIGGALLLSGRTWEGLFLLGWGSLVVATLDNLIRPRLCGTRIALHPLAVFLATFGGLAVFGVGGLLLGPLVASLLMAMVRIYRRDFLTQAAATGAAGAPADRPHLV